MEMVLLTRNYLIHLVNIPHYHFRDYRQEIYRPYLSLISAISWTKYIEIQICCHFYEFFGYGMKPCLKNRVYCISTFFQIILVKSCWEGCGRHFPSHLIRYYSNYWLYYLGNAMLLCPPPPYSMLVGKSPFWCVENPTLITGGREVISKVLIHFQHFSPWL